MKVKSESEVTQSCPTLSDPMDCSLPGSSIHGIFQARVLEWGATAFSAFKATIVIIQMGFGRVAKEKIQWTTLLHPVDNFTAASGTSRATYPMREVPLQRQCF